MLYNISDPLDTFINGLQYLFHLLIAKRSRYLVDLLKELLNRQVLSLIEIQRPTILDGLKFTCVVRAVFTNHQLLTTLEILNRRGFAKESQRAIPHCAHSFSNDLFLN